MWNLARGIAAAEGVAKHLRGERRARCAAHRALLVARHGQHLVAPGAHRVLAHLA
eukprot:CAMPEP_0118813988 /NCGR_PEP_ID=MMETSP1162-20130426/3295_1 /TAXON_ID=33656 /ORGANISM="Phaeocystis Sp, Strain CCMP2710" /LENGTH=54 /DNA_ID=CAMNT_0006743839 /DNA_START=127 /DNA_END=287 /DNA_ORIENTATION=+